MNTNAKNSKKIEVTDVVLRDGHQSLIATRLRTEDMLPICEQLDAAGFWSLEIWGGATFDACVRFLKEDPWERLRQLRQALPNSRLQMLLRGQNLLGYRHYGDDVVDAFVERAAANGIDVFRVFDAMNDPRNLETALRAVKANGKHAQGTLCYTTGPVHTPERFVKLAKQLADMGSDSIAIKDMAGLLTPYATGELVAALKDAVDLPLFLHSHNTSGLAPMCQLKAIENGVDHIDTAMSPFAGGTSHPATESMVAALKGTPYDTGLDLEKLQPIADYFREVRKKYHQFESDYTREDIGVQVNQVPGGMMSNLANQLKEQGALDKIGQVFAEIPRVRQDLGYPPLVTPTSQIVGTQAVMNVMAGERYKALSKETRGILRGEYGEAPAPFDEALRERALEGDQPITCRPADRLDNELDALGRELEQQAGEEGIELATGERRLDDVLTYALFPQIGLKFLANRGNPDAFEPVPTAEDDGQEEGVYTVTVEGQRYTVTVSDGGDIDGIKPLDGGAPAASGAAPAAPTGDGEPVPAPLAGNIFEVLVKPGQRVEEGERVLVLEAMKMETDVAAPRAGTVAEVRVKPGDAVAVGDVLLTIGG